MLTGVLQVGPRFQCPRITDREEPISGRCQCHVHSTRVFQESDFALAVCPHAYQGYVVDISSPVCIFAVDFDLTGKGFRRLTKSRNCLFCEVYVIVAECDDANSLHFSATFMKLIEYLGKRDCLYAVPMRCSTF
jgi:hypothetical protein